MGLKENIVRFGSVFFISLAIKQPVDYILNPFIMIKLGFILSIIITTSIYLIIGVISVKLYDLKKTDIFGFEALKNTQNNSEEGNKKNLIQWIIEISRSGLLLYFKNAGLLVIYFRNGSYLYNGFAGKNIKLFFVLYLLITNISWNIIVYLGISIIKLIFGLLTKNQNGINN